MSAITYFVALPIQIGEDGELFAGEGIECRTAQEAARRASGLAATHAGAVAFSRTGDPASGEFEPAVVLARYGELPADLIEMMGDGA